eukprot:586279_1
MMADVLNVDQDDEGILLILERYYSTGYRVSADGLSNTYKELRTIFGETAYRTGLSPSDNYLDAISKGNVKASISVIRTNSVSPYYIKTDWTFGTAHALHYILQNLKYIKEHRSTQHPKYRELVDFVKQYLLPRMTGEYINTKFFRGGDVLHRGTHYPVMEMIIAVNDIDLFRLIVNECKHIIHFHEKATYFGGMAYGSKEWSLLDYCVDNDIDSQIFEYLLTEPPIPIDVNEYIDCSGGMFGSKPSVKYTLLHKIIQNNNIKWFKMLMKRCGDVDINATHASTNFIEQDDEWVHEKTSKTALHIAIEDSNEYLVKLLIIHGIDVNIKYSISMHNEEDNTMVVTQEMDVFEFIALYGKSKSNQESFKNILNQRYMSDMFDEYPLQMQQSIRVILLYFPVYVGEIVLEYFL